MYGVRSNRPGRGYPRWPGTSWIDFSERGEATAPFAPVSSGPRGAAEQMTGFPALAPQQQSQLLRDGNSSPRRERPSMTSAVFAADAIGSGRRNGERNNGGTFRVGAQRVRTLCEPCRRDRAVAPGVVKQSQRRDADDPEANKPSGDLLERRLGAVGGTSSSAAGATSRVSCMVPPLVWTRKVLVGVGGW